MSAEPQSKSNSEVSSAGSGYARYQKFFLSGPMPYLTVAATVAITVFFAFHIKNFKMDASSDSITLEHDKDLKYYDQTRQIFGSDDYVFVVLTPREDLFSDAALNGIKELAADLENLPGVQSVSSILTVALFHSPDVPLLKLASDYRTLGKGNADRELARKELSASPLYSNYLISEDGKKTIIQATFKSDPEFVKLMFRRYALRDRSRDGALTPEETRELQTVEKDYRRKYLDYSAQRDANIRDVRTVLEKHKTLGTFHLGGVPMIVSDMVGFIHHDIALFGVLVILFTVFMMALIFRRIKLFLLPMLACIFTVVIMVGYLGYADWHTTVVTANFTSLLLIMTTENAILLASKWRQLLGTYPEKPARELVALMTVPVAVPCAFSTFTTLIGFMSLMVSGIRPIMDFGLMMTIGLTVGFAVCFLFIPAMLAILPKERPIAAAELAEASDSTISIFARLAATHPAAVLGVGLACLSLGFLGTRRLTVENMFQDYFRKSTAIYKGMNLVDSELGGTTPLEVVLDGGRPDFWFEQENLARLRRVHDYLAAQPEIGKVISLDTMVRMIEGVNNGKPLSKTMLSLVRKNLPPDMVKSILQPYVTDDFRQVRITMRVKEGYKDLNRKALLEKVDSYLEKTEGFKLGETAHVTGMFVLYNNMLQTLFTSQIATVGSVFLTCFITFTIIFRNIWLALMGLVPNVLAVTIILGLIGWLGIPLDMMTIMVAAITFGLADDNAIQYIHAFKKEFPKDRDYKAAMYRCHNTIGRGLSYSMITIVAGFAILVFSDFMPTVYFGVFTGIAMFLSLVASHSLLPLLIIYLKPLGRPGRPPSAQ
ncbi:MMPL family transporter [Candidatus Sumerlaeota bacterium]|nr:MMPL family transporter [Candidatus Sumerlaeota bacterium]